MTRHEQVEATHLATATPYHASCSVSRWQPAPRRNSAVSNCLGATRNCHNLRRQTRTRITAEPDKNQTWLRAHKSCLITIAVLVALPFVWLLPIAQLTVDLANMRHSHFAKAGPSYW